jgi:hypothetical protein
MSYLFSTILSQSCRKKHHRLLFIWNFFLLFKGRELRLFSYHHLGNMIAEKGNIYFFPKIQIGGDSFTFDKV